MSTRRCRFVQPSIVRLDLSCGDYVDVKKRLSVGDERTIMQQMVGELHQDGWRKPNIEMAGIAELAAWIHDWSFVDPQGVPVPPTIEALKQLDPVDYLELETAVQAHVTRVQAEAQAEKNAQAGGIA